MVTVEPDLFQNAFRIGETRCYHERQHHKLFKLVSSITIVSYDDDCQRIGLADNF